MEAPLSAGTPGNQVMAVISPIFIFQARQRWSTIGQACPPMANTPPTINDGRQLEKPVRTRHWSLTNGQPTREVKWGPGRQIILEYYNDFKCRHGEDLDLFKGPT